MNQKYEHKFRDQGNEIVAWLAELPADNMSYLRLDTFSHKEWIEKGRKIPELEDKLIELLADQDERVNLPDVAYALGWFGSEKSVPVLLSSLENDDLSLRMESVAALGRIGDPNSFESLRDLFVDEDENIRGNVCIAIGKLCHKDSKAFLNLALEDKNEFVAACAKEGLRILENECYTND